MPHLEHKEKEAPAKPREDNLTHEQQRFAISKPVGPKPFVTPSVKSTPIAPVKNDEEAPDLEDFLVSIPPKAERPRSASSYLSAPRILQEEPQEPVRTRMAQPVTEPTPAVHTPAPEPEDEPMVVVPPVSAPEVKDKPQILQPLDAGVRVIGECFQTYIIAEDKDGLILIDKHAAHERILFNKLRAETDMPQQQLLTPVIVELTGEEAAAVQSQIVDIRQAGFAIDSFGENSFAVRSVPAYLDSGDVQSVISELAEKAMNSRTTVPDRLDDLIHTVACKAAIKAGKPTTMTELQDLCERVLSDDNVRSCPHGRPTTVRLTKYELDKMFKRVNQ
jgi:DNA mismatch repair protein MutL